MNLLKKKGKDGGTLMSHEFKVGDRVRLREDSYLCGQSGGTIGTVTELRRDYNFPYSVLWGGRYGDNVYHACDLQYTSIFYAETDKKGLVI